VTRGKAGRPRASSATWAECAGGTPALGRLFRPVLGLALAMAAVLVIASPALAVTEGYKYSYSFSQPGPATGLFGFGMGLAIDQSTGDVYVSEFENHRLLKFDSAGNFLQAWGYGVSDGQEQSEVCTAPEPCQAGIYGTAPGQFSNATGVAVDNSNGPNQGDVYVVDGPSPYSGLSSGVVLKFNSSGHFLGKIDGAESDTGVFKEMGWNGAVSVDDNGFVWATGGPVMKFSNDLDNEFVLGSEWSSTYPVWSVTANGPGTRLLVGGYGSGNGESPYITSAGGTTVVGHLPCGGYFNGGTAYDGATENFLVANGGEVCEFTQKGVLVSRFGSGKFSYIGGLGVNTTTGDVYVADPGGTAVRVFIPRVVPDVTTGDVTALGHTTATLAGQVAPDPAGGGDVSDCHFEIGTDTSYGTNVPCVPATPYSSAREVSADLSGLSMETTYHYRLVAENSIDSNAGADKTFTPHAVLGLSTDPATNLTPVSATLNGSFDPNSDSTDYYFEWGTDTSYGNTTPVATCGSAITCDPGDKSVSAEIGELAAYTKYHYRIVATNSLGSSYGEDQTLVTSPPELPAIHGTSVSEVTDSSARISSVVNPGFGMTEYSFEYGTDSTYGLEEPGGESIGPDDNDHPVEAVLSDLDPGTTYHLRVVATNFGGTTHGAEVTFTTLDVPSVGIEGVSEVTQTTATLTASVNPNNTSTTIHFEYGPTPEYGSATRETDSIGADGVSHGLEARLSGLSPDTTYHFRLVATNEVGRTTDVDHVFKTQAPLPQAASSPAKCRTGFVRRKGRCVKRHNHRHRHRRHHRGHR
jgi:NHL repeat-containing protein